jgi:hypothetical protein
MMAGNPDDGEWHDLIAEAWELLRIAHLAHQKLGFEGRGATGLSHEVRMFAAEFSEAQEPRTPQHTILTGTGRYRKWREAVKERLATRSP